MPDQNTIEQVIRVFRKRFDREPDALSYAPGRAEILGNHTDYNDGFVISCAIDMGVFFACAANNTNKTTLFAADYNEQATFNAKDPAPDKNKPWANYPAGVNAAILKQLPESGISGIDALITSSIPQGAGLSSSAALEVATLLGLRKIFKFKMDPMSMAKTAQWAENNFAGAQCGLMDQISCLFGKKNHFVFTDFRSLEVEKLPLNDDARLIMCDTGKKHNLVESEYNERRQSCEKAAEFFNKKLDRPVSALRDVTVEDMDRFAEIMDTTSAKRARHVIDENNRVLKGRRLLFAEHNIPGFGRLMFDSHESSRTNFENSCDELDFVVNLAAKLDNVYGARLSGGGFGGSVVILTNNTDAKTVSGEIQKSFKKTFGAKCQTRIILPSDGASIINTD